MVLKRQIFAAGALPSNVPQRLRRPCPWYANAKSSPPTGGSEWHGEGRSTQAGKRRAWQKLRRCRTEGSAAADQ